ncbi:hypothetical protein [Liquorilactobacillus uvarum]|uniref:hypothetical protein n=1 Tax=Liquorilactobacillus uvarum TaxID=303240 RepID=UPI002889EF15|nr:hypothetical protein [Liquorilactobacillus uvarum]
MRRWMWLIAAFVIAIIFVGYGYTKHVETEQYYRNSFQQGRSALKAGKYTAAENHFRNAQKKKASSDVASVYVKQIQKYKEGLQSSKDGEYDAAKNAFNEAAGIENGSPTLVRRASVKKTELEEVARELKIFQKNYKKASVLSSNYEYTASNLKLATILGYGNIDKSYYDDIYKKAKKLEAYNNRVLAGLGYRTASATSSSSTSRSILPSDSNNGLGQNGDDNGQTNGDNDTLITKEQIRKARRDIASQGIDVSAFKDRDVKEVIQRARSHQMTVKEVAQEFK